MTQPRSTPSAAGAERLVGIATGYMGAKQLFAAVDLGLFRALADGPRTAAELAERLGIGERAARILADSMNALGLLDRKAGRYENGEAARDWLAGDGPIDLGPFFSFLNAVSYGHWLQFETSVRTGTNGVLNLEGTDLGMIGKGIGAYQSLHAAMFVAAFDVRPYRRLLDLGGQSARFAIEAMTANPELSTSFVYDPSETASIERAVAEAGLAGRVRIEPAPTPAARPQGEYDLVLLNHCIHRFSADENRRILASARAAASPGAALAIVDFVLDDDARQRPVDALHAAEYLVIDDTIAYPVSEIHGWLDATGWAPEESIALAGSPRALIARAV